VIYLLLTNKTVNDLIDVLIVIFGKSLNYKGNSAQKFIFVILFTSFTKC